MAMTTFLKTIAVAIFLVTSIGPQAGPSVTEGARILAIAPIPLKSRWGFMSGVLRALTANGHNVTAFVPFPDGDRDNYTEVDLSGRLENIKNSYLAKVRHTRSGYTDILRFVHDLSVKTCAALYEHDAMRRVVNSTVPNFDVVIADYFASECVGSASAALHVPLVYLVPSPLPSFVDRATLGHVPNPASVSHVLFDQTVPRTFLDRLTNVVATAYTAGLLRYLEWSSKNAHPRPTSDLPAPVKPSLLFVNAHYVTDASRPLPPVVVPVGGVHLKPPKALPADILEFLDNSPHGVILFSLGSIMSLSSLPKHIHDVVITSLGQFPQRVLMKYENDLKNKSNNMMTKKWIPQRDVLMHSSVKLFISHGGISGVYEAVDAGIPVLGFPVNFDQPRNLKNLVDAGMALSLDLSSISEKTFVKSVTELINNTMYSKNAKIVSERFKDRPMTPEQTINYWTNYVIRHKGAPHLKPHAINLTWYQYFLLDVIVVIILLIVLIVFIIINIRRKLFQYCGLKITKIDLKPKSE